MPVPTDALHALIAFTRQRWKSPACQLCGHNEWAIEGPAEIPVRHPAGSFGPGTNVEKPVLPCATFTCRYCGNTVFVNMIAAGLVQK